MKTIIHLILTLFVLGVIAGGSLALVDGWSSPLIAENQRAETERAIYLVQPQGKTYQRVEQAGCELYKVYDDNKDMVGYSLVYEGNGFQGKIRLIAGVTPDLKKLTSIEILDQVETPGLGTKVTEEPFIGQFNDLTVSPAISLVKGVSPSTSYEVQAVTGATITSRSVVAIMNAGIERLSALKKEGKI